MLAWNQNTVPTIVTTDDSNIDSRYYSDVTNLLDIKGGLEHCYSSLVPLSRPSLQDGFQTCH